MEVVKCGLCKEEIEYSQRCRVYIKTDEPRNAQRISKRPHIGRYKLISTATSTEHISFAKRLKNLRKNNKDRKSTDSIPENKSEKPTLLTNFSLEENLESTTKPSIEDKAESSVKSSDSKKSKKKTNNKGGSSENTTKVMNHPHFQSSFEEYIKPILSKAPSAKITKTKSSDSNSDLEVNRKGAGNTYRPMKNGSVRSSLQEFETYYWLDMPKTKAPEAKKLGYQFENLVTEVKHMKLPSSEWKIKIMVHKQEMVSVSFSNKQTPEKVVSINAKNSVCDISIDNKKLTLCGSPVYIYSIKDLETLLDIMNSVDPDSSLIQYT